MTAVRPEELKRILEEGEIAIDVRSGQDFAARHVPGSVNISLSGQFASWAGTLVELKARPVLIADTPEQLAEARTRLARIGLDQQRGYLEGGVKGWEEAGFESASLPQMSVQDLHEHLKSRVPHVIDVRRGPEWQAGHIGGAMLHPLDGFKAALPDLQPDKPVIVICKSGYRSSVACSLLQRAGFRNVTSVIGGFDAWRKAGLPVVTEDLVAA